jgi:long-chain acyl-CoA synthetase
MQYIVENSAATALIANGFCAEVARELRCVNPGVKLAVAVGGAIEGFEDYKSVVAGQPGGELEDETEGDDIIYTSGTTGRPKGGLRPLSGRHPRDLDLTTIPSAILEAGIGPDTCFLTPGAPLYHAAPLRTAMATTRFGGTNVVMERFDAEGPLVAIEAHRVTISQWVPTMFVRLLKLPEGVRNRCDLSSHQLALHAAAPCPIAVKERMLEWWGPILFEFYGASEGGGSTSITSEEWLTHKGSVGRAKTGVLHILDEAGNELPAGESGLIYAEGGRPVQYLDDPEKTATPYSKEGWVTVGDLGDLDEGYLYLTDRKAFVIVSGGVNIYPQEAEDVLMQHPLATDVAVVGTPNEEFGEEVKAVVQLVAHADATDAVAQELLAFCRNRLAHYKCPRSVDFVDELPRSRAGKLYKHRIRAVYWQSRDGR